VRGGRVAGRRSVGYRSVRVLLQRPTGQRITRNSRLDSAEFERAPADLAFLHRFASLCFALASPRLSSQLSRKSLSLLVPTGIPRSPPSLPVSTRSLQPGYPADSRNRIEILLCADRLSGSPADYGRQGEERSRTKSGFSKFGKYLGSKRKNDQRIFV